MIDKTDTIVISYDFENHSETYPAFIEALKNLGIGNPRKEHIQQSVFHLKPVATQSAENTPHSETNSIGEIFESLEEPIGDNDHLLVGQVRAYRRSTEASSNGLNRRESGAYFITYDLKKYEDPRDYPDLYRRIEQLGKVESIQDSVWILHPDNSKRIWEEVNVDGGLETIVTHLEQGLRSGDKLWVGQMVDYRKV